MTPSASPVKQFSKKQVKAKIVENISFAIKQKVE
jgi:hypothetical protein